MNETAMPANVMGSGEVKTFNFVYQDRKKKATEMLRRRTLEKRENTGDAK